MSTLTLLLLILTVLAFTWLVVALVRTVRADGYGPRADDRPTWFDEPR